MKNSKKCVIEQFIYSDEVRKKAQQRINKIIQNVCAKLGEIIDSHVELFRREESFKVRPGYGYDKFFLTNVDGNYDMSLESLIYYILYDDGYFRTILNDRLYDKLEKAIDEYPEGICAFTDTDESSLPQLERDENQYAENLMNEIIYDCIEFVAKKLIELGFDVKEEFEGWLED